MKYKQFLRDHKVGTLILVMAVLSVVGLGHLVSAQSFASLGTTLGPGSQGTNVTALQTFLASNPRVYPQGLVTGYYGPLTEAAVRNFQIGYAIDPVGRVGPITLGAINGVISSGKTPDVSSPTFSSVSVDSIMSSSARINWTTDEAAIGKVFFDRSPIMGTDAQASKREPTLSGSVISEMTLNNSKSVTLTSLLANTTYYYIVESIDTSGNVTVSSQGTFKTSI